ncbi:Methyl-accepting chemotaxis protein [Stutzerimonas kunmingensis]|uniref:methyl-accepting chemotaxis protein n=1 Tax=Stutzerimonas kunmingensis TaxID=1211807 RepID=UPI0008EF3DFB|nr:methyl-accepting chemotaxis protein [Stutzerimonas kunmingensis]MCQ2044503.1 methyl-accepting chemotaxis protein [Stutzerimonas kunmingensis]SFJ99193.1 Methyl-accepting chemotaxis protein [Stutzerimonas kunmingensis]
MPHLQSNLMHLSASERHWLPWSGPTGKLAMRWSCWLNRGVYPVVEQVFEGVAQSRVRILQNWVASHWGHLADLAANLGEAVGHVASDVLEGKRAQLPDISELFVIDSQGRVLASTCAAHVGQQDLDGRAVARGMSEPFLHGPYRDPLTQRLGASTSRFHDAVTLMFYQPVHVGGKCLGCICARVPNDVIGDLIQREAGHVYPESGDNYLFMVESRFDSSVQTGTALSRSRFEDATFSHGENLKSGVHTRWGTVRVQQHTELELRFTDPATGQLHPGVRETIAKGANLFVTYPGYSDYRHIPVIGKGVTFQLQGSPDRWGMMCEADLEEVYRRRSLSVGLMKTYLLTVTTLFAIGSLLHEFSGLPTTALHLVNGLLLLLGAWAFASFGPRRLAARMQEMTEVIRTLAEGEGNLRQRVDSSTMQRDESGDMGRWINSFIDSLDGVVGQVIQVSKHVRQDNELMLERSSEAGQTTSDVAESIHQLLLLVEEQLGEIQQASMTAEEMKGAMDEVMQRARERFDTVRNGTESIRDVVQRSAQSVQLLDSRMGEIDEIVGLISDITTQTNLLALNAAIEAARAGDHGRGFAVVAGEVRSLAQRTAKAAEDIRHKVESLQAETRQAVSFMEGGVQNVDSSLRLTEEASSENVHLHHTVERMFDIIKGLNERSLHYGQTIRGVDQASNEMGQTLGVLKDSAERVRHTAGKLHQLVGRFRVSAANSEAA